MSRIIMELPPLPQYINTGFTRYTAGEQHPNRRNIGLYDWLFVISGALYIGEEERQWEVGQGQSLLLLPKCSHYATEPCRSETEFFWVHFNYEGECLYGDEEQGPAPLRHAWAYPYRLVWEQHATHSRFAAITRLLEHMLEETKSGGALEYWREQRHFMELLSILEDEGRDSRYPSSVMKLAERAEIYLRQHYQSEITNELLGRVLHFHPNYIVRCMKEIFRCTPMEYLNRIRMEQAKLLLIKTEWPIVKVAEHVGFQYAPYFSACFKRYTGMPPQAFRQLYFN